MTREELTPCWGRASKLAPRPGRSWLRRFLLLAACVVALDALVGERSLLQAVRAEREVKRAAGKLVDLRRQNAELQERIQQLQENAEAIESVAREELGLIRRGEILVVLSDTPRR